MSTKKSAGKLQGTQSAREKMRFDSTSATAYVDKSKVESTIKKQRKLAPKKLPVALAGIYPQQGDSNGAA